MLEYDCDAKSRQDFRQHLQDRIKAYFEGSYEDFSDIEIGLPSVSAFSKAILTTCHRMQYGAIFTYEKLAEAAGKDRAARAAGSVMAKNPLPLIVPCHRVIRANGAAGEFSAEGGTEMKKRLLALEARVVSTNSNPCLSST